MSEKEHVFITGVSKGIGKAIAELFLEQGYVVTGIGRSSSIQHEKYSFLELDLSDRNAVESFEVPPTEAEKILLINNAGVLGKVTKAKKLSGDDIAYVLQVNTIAPIQLSGKIAVFCGSTKEFTLVNISSGAAKKAIPGWSSYCLSKAALDSFSATFFQEEKEAGRQTRVYSVAPGVVDTAMQAQIRKLSPDDFPSVENFIELKRSGELYTPEIVAQKLLKLLQKEYDGEILKSLREVE